VVNLKGAIVSHSKRIKMAIEIETGSLVSEKGVEKRTYFFTPAAAGSLRVLLCIAFMSAAASVNRGPNETRSRAEHIATDEESKRKQRREEKKMLETWFQWLQEESAKTFTPA
jgi:hypothetical protein